MICVPTCNMSSGNHDLLQDPWREMTAEESSWSCLTLVKASTSSDGATRRWYILCVILKTDSFGSWRRVWRVVVYWLSCPRPRPWPAHSHGLGLPPLPRPWPAPSHGPADLPPPTALVFLPPPIALA